MALPNPTFSKLTLMGMLFGATYALSGRSRSGLALYSSSLTKASGWSSKHSCVGDSVVPGTEQDLNSKCPPRCDVSVTSTSTISPLAYVCCVLTGMTPPTAFWG